MLAQRSWQQVAFRYVGQLAHQILIPHDVSRRELIWHAPTLQAWYRGILARRALIGGVRSDFLATMREIDGSGQSKELDCTVVYSRLDRLCRPSIVRKRFLGGAAISLALRPVKVDMHVELKRAIGPNPQPAPINAVPVEKRLYSAGSQVDKVRARQRLLEELSRVRKDIAARVRALRDAASSVCARGQATSNLVSAPT